ncbi:Stage II sporulation protein E (SpoIIE) [Pelotomaculum sp. FP]|uniref:SpoIIE family protein phosphatase n=1 Tax=Pelotomaculum sp. FP TaxID=261474 RepID=UPI001064A48C|nr:SpoIIE family protein phosphatase [Pelotomaculum sp. FP]TEB14028.1 Stage II sporulation protein E (SpoIIE) [Pelotomaculum sp. FP]
MSFYLDIGYSQLNKKGEELCGDSVETLRSDDVTVIVLADGLGSGVKANILSRITAKTAATMLKMGCSVDEVLETIAVTLPMCKVRKLAYSTFSILQIDNNGQAYLAEFDNPHAYLGKKGSLYYLNRDRRRIGDKEIAEARFKLEEGNWLVLISDGVLHAGLGGVLNLGWGELEVGKHIKDLAAKGYDAADLALEVIKKCNELYGGKPGDDVSVVAVKYRKLRTVTALVGPPRNPADDRKAIAKLLAAGGKKVVCGGTTSKIVSRITGKKVEVNLAGSSEEVPPTGFMQGIDLVTEGAITLYCALQLLKKGVKLRDVNQALDGASQLVSEFLQADEVHFIVGLAVNQAMHYPGFPLSCVMKNQTVRDVAEMLLSIGKKVTIEYF